MTLEMKLKVTVELKANVRALGVFRSVGQSCCGR